jgi:beta-lactam-binding protein with PASTA domain
LAAISSTQVRAAQPGRRRSPSELYRSPNRHCRESGSARPNPVGSRNRRSAFSRDRTFSSGHPAGDKTPKNNFVTIYVSLGPPKTDVPSVVGEPLDQALSDLQDAKLKGKVIRTDSDKPQGQVISQSPTAGASVQQGSQVKLKVSKGPKPVAVPNLIGSTFESANSILLGMGFAVKRQVVTSDAPKDTVVDTSPGVGTLQPPGTTITVMVSKGPTTSTVPDVTTLSQSDAQATLKASGFGARIVTNRSSTRVGRHVGPGTTPAVQQCPARLCDVSASSLDAPLRELSAALKSLRSWPAGGRPGSPQLASRPARCSNRSILRSTARVLRRCRDRAEDLPGGAQLGGRLSS